MLRAKTLAMACLLPCLLQRNMTRYIYSMQREKNPLCFYSYFILSRSTPSFFPFVLLGILPEEQAKEKVSYADYRFLANIYIYI